MFEQYNGKYVWVPYTEVLNYLTAVLDIEDFKLWQKENNIKENGIHIRAMNQMYYLYEQYKDNALQKGAKKYISVMV